MTKPKTCFSCGTETHTSVQTKQHKRRVFVCDNGRCWTIYYDTLAKGD